jgi:hypothetical protein
MRDYSPSELARAKKNSCVLLRPSQSRGRSKAPLFWIPSGASSAGPTQAIASLMVGLYRITCCSTANEQSAYVVGARAVMPGAWPGGPIHTSGCRWVAVAAASIAFTSTHGTVVCLSRGAVAGAGSPSGKQLQVQLTGTAGNLSRDPEFESRSPPPSVVAWRVSSGFQGLHSWRSGCEGSG